MRICFFGESYVNGVGDPTTQGWVGRLCAGRGLTVYNCGIRGATSTLIHDTWFAEAMARLPRTEKAVVVFSYGTNDCWIENCWIENGQPQVPLEAQLANTKAILELAASYWPVLFVGPPGLPAYADNTMREADHIERCARTKALCAELSIPFFDTLSAYSQFKQWKAEASAGDGAHPGPGGYAEMAEAISMWKPWTDVLL